MNSPQGKHAWTVKVGEKGQIVIPKEAREIFNIQPGNTLIILGDEGQGLAILKQEMLAKFAEAILKAPPPPEDES
ncbi:MAG: AbrB/MazE/SpoVT family DNA-binding domain-containing protein [Anaerolinea sp.]|nr:AbrB/MazE/SpoVT family DNA-binding domain-containing protein [Anaerolinea sp.]